MGYFSWNTSDTKETIVIGDLVTLILPDNSRVSGVYDGYGRIGTIDIFACIAQFLGQKGDYQQMRKIAIDACSEKKEDPFPIKLSFNQNARFENLEIATPDRTQAGVFGEPIRTVTPLPR